jgi:hypothetical protein
MLYFSAQAVGDGSPVVIDINTGSFKDLAGNDLVAALGLQVIEIADTIAPTIDSSATLTYGDGLVRLAMSETIDLTPLSLFNISAIFFGNATGDKVIQLNGATIASVDSQFLTIQLTELQRVTAIALSGTNGGDGKSLTLDLDAPAFVDLSSNVNVPLIGHPIIETSDLIKPQILSVTFNYSDGIVVLNTSETIDVTPGSKVDLQYVAVTNENDTSSTPISLFGASVVEVDALAITLHTSEHDRANAYYVSGLLGGDGGTSFLRTDPGFIVDIAQNTVDGTVFT